MKWVENVGYFEYLRPFNNPKRSRTPVAERARILNKIADEIDANAKELSRAESSDQGKPLWLSSSIDIPRAAHNFRFFASAIITHKNESMELAHLNAFSYTNEVPVGVACLISPWNLPLYLLTWKIAPCLASGCTCVCKPSEFTSLTAYLLCDIMLKVIVYFLTVIYYYFILSLKILS